MTRFPVLELGQNLKPIGDLGFQFECSSQKFQSLEPRAEAATWVINPPFGVRIEADSERMGHELGQLAKKVGLLGGKTNRGVFLLNDIQKRSFQKVTFEGDETFRRVSHGGLSLHVWQAR